MDQSNIGKFILAKRREKNLTQEQLAEKLGVTNKAISKWENGKCIPDYSVIELLCKELDITLAELLDGEEKEQKKQKSYHIRLLLCFPADLASQTGCLPCLLIFESLPQGGRPMAVLLR